MSSRVEQQTGPLLTACAWCGRVENAGEWIESEAGVRDLAQLFGAASEPAFTHGICPDCFAALEAARIAQHAPLVG
jgi:hypothetical protein